MINSREKILKRIRQSHKIDEPMDKLEKTYFSNPAHQTHLISQFTQRANQAGAQIIPITSLADIPKNIQKILIEQDQQPELTISACSLIQEIPWENTPTLIIHHDPLKSNEQATITESISGIAETGTLCMVSTHQHAGQLNFLPKFHFVLLDATKIVANYEQAWMMLNQNDLPRTINFITGPSKTADIEQTLLLGAHGPKYLFIFLLNKRNEM